jgi:hypothetical protein
MSVIHHILNTPTYVGGRGETHMCGREESGMFVPK